MKTIWKIIKSFLKIIGLLIVFNIIVIAIFSCMIYFSDLAKYNEIVEQVFIQSTGQTLQIIGETKFNAGKQLTVKIDDSVVILSPERGNISIDLKSLTMHIPWWTLLKQGLDQTVFEAEGIDISIVRKNHPSQQIKFKKLSATLNETCCDLRVNQLIVLTEQGEARGSLQLKPVPSGVMMNGKMEAKEWRINEQIKDGENVFSMEGFDKLEGKIDFKIGVLHTRQEDRHNVDAVIDWQKHTLTIVPSHVILPRVSP